MRRALACTGALVGALLGQACMATSDDSAPPASTLIVAVDVSGSFGQSYDDAIAFAAYYIYGHLHGLGDLQPPTALFVGSVGGERPGEPKTFHPIEDFKGRTVEEIATDLRSWFQPGDVLTDFDPFFERVATLVKERGLILAPLNVVLLSDGVPDLAGGKRAQPGESIYERIDVSPLEYLSRSVTVRLLYASPTVGDHWKRLIPRKRVRMWTQEAPVMVGWRRQVEADLPPEQQPELWGWVESNVDFRVRMSRLF